MAIYRLWRESDNKTFDDIEARDHEHAITIFGEKLDIKLTLTEGPAEPGYMMQRMEKEVSWTPAPDISVWEER